MVQIQESATSKALIECNETFFKTFINEKKKQFVRTILTTEQVYPKGCTSRKHFFLSIGKQYALLLLSAGQLCDLRLWV